MQAVFAEKERQFQKHTTNMSQRTSARRAEHFEVASHFVGARHSVSRPDELVLFLFVFVEALQRPLGELVGAAPRQEPTLVDQLVNFNYSRNTS